MQKKEPTALLQYQVVSPGTYELYHAEVPPEFRGKGIAKVIAK
jgi:predicted GNAT family acetyltransferase